MLRTFLPLASLLVLAAPLFGQAPPNDVLLPRAAEQAKRDENDALAYAEMLRAAGRTANSHAALAQSGHDDLLCWRQLPAPGERDALREAVARLRKSDAAN